MIKDETLQNDGLPHKADAEQTHLPSTKCEKRKTNSYIFQIHFVEKSGQVQEGPGVFPGLLFHNKTQGRYVRSADPKCKRIISYTFMDACFFIICKLGCSNTVSTKLQLSKSFSEGALQNDYPSPSKQLKDGKRIKKMWAPKSKCLSFFLQNGDPIMHQRGGSTK